MGKRDYTAERSVPGRLVRPGIDRKNIFTDDGSGATVGQEGLGRDSEGVGGETSIVFPDSTIQVADRAMVLWLRERMKGDEQLLQGLRVQFVAGERWALMKGDNAILTKDGVPVLPLIAVSRESVRWGKGLAQGAFTDTAKLSFFRRETQALDGRAGYVWTDITPPIPFEISYSLDFWVRDSEQLNVTIWKFWEIQRNRIGRENVIADPVSGWNFNLRFEDSFSIGENLDDFTGAQRLVRSTITGTLSGIHLRSASARQRSYGSVNSVNFQISEQEPSSPSSTLSAPFQARTTTEQNELIEIGKGERVFRLTGTNLKNRRR